MMERFHWMIRQLRDLLLVPIASLMPRNKKKIVFGAWEGKSLSDNPKYLMRWLLGHSDKKCVWIGEESLRPLAKDIKGCSFARRGSLVALWHMLTASWFVYNINWTSDIGTVPTVGRVKLMNLWHGIPYKKIGRRQLCGDEKCDAITPKSKLRIIMRKMLIGWNKLLYPHKCWTSVSSLRMGEIMCDAWPEWFSRDRMIYAGLSRNDYLLRGGVDIDQVKLKYSKMLGLPIEKKWYLYLPTWRRVGAGFSFCNVVNPDALNGILDRQNAIIIEKQHPITLASLKIDRRDGRVIVMSASDAQQVDLQELMMVSDRLITDYSSCFFDYELLGRPVIHFAYDLKEYERNIAGTLYDLHDIAAGPIACDQKELLEILNRSDSTLLSQKGAHSGEPIAFETGIANIELARIIDSVKLRIE